jgi:hypothetical protein
LEDGWKRKRETVEISVHREEGSIDELRLPAWYSRLSGRRLKHREAKGAVAFLVLVGSRCVGRGDVVE